MTEREALKLALEALKELRMLGMNMQWHDSWLAKSETAITAIREALAQPEQELLTWAGVDFDINTTPPQRTWVGLTAQEAATIAESVYGSAHHDDITFFIEIQTKLKEKNT